MRHKNLADLYGLPPIDWTSVEAWLNAELSQAPGTGGPDRHTCWLATIDPDGKPHVTGIGALWVGGAFWFVSGDRTRKSKNLARDPRCTLSVATHECDLVIQGQAQKITDQTDVAAMAKAYAAQGWPATADETGTALTAPYSAPSAGPPPWFVYRITAKTATVLSTIEPGGATRFSF
jgi:hypothetical protein